MRLAGIGVIVTTISFAGPLGARPPEAPARQEGPCVFDVRAARPQLSATAVSGCLFERLSAECHGSAPCLFYIDRSGVHGPTEPSTPHVSLFIDPDELHATVGCKAHSCLVSFSAGNGKREEHRLDSGQSLVGPLQARVSVSPSTKP